VAHWDPRRLVCLGLAIVAGGMLIGSAAPSLPLFLLGIGNNLGAAVGPWLSGLLFDRTGSYLAIYLCALGVALTGLTALSVFCLVTRAAPAIRPA